MTSAEPTPKKLYRSDKDKVIAGVAGGIGEYLEVDPLLIRLAFVVLAVGAGSGVLLYLICWVLIPLRGMPKAEDPADAIKQGVEEVAQEVRQYWNRDDSRKNAGLLVIVVGILLLTANLNILSFKFLASFWPLVLVFIGLEMLARSRK